MTVINTNTAAVNAQYNLSKVQSEQENAMERLSSGLRINSASDDAAGVAIASRMNAEITGTNMAIRNAMDSQALIDTAEGAHVEVENILQRMRELSVQSANDTYSDSDRSNLQAELSQLQTEIDRIAMATNWGGKALLNGTALTSPATAHSDQKALQFQVGTGSSLVNSIDVSIGAISSQALGVGVGSNAADVGSALVKADTTNVSASISIDGGTVSISGKPEVGDVFKFDVNGEEISVTYSVSDEYSDNLAGLSAQMRDALNAKINASNVSPSLANVSVADNGDGSVTLTQSTTPNIDTLLNDESGGTGANNSAIDLIGNSVRLSGTFDAGDKFGVTINGVAIEITAAASDAYTDDFTGLSAQLAAKINSTADLDYVTAVDNQDGSVTVTQASSPVVQAAETTLAKTQTATLAFSDSTAISGSKISIQEHATPAAKDLNVITLTTENGEAITFGARNVASTTAGDVADLMKAAFDGLADKKGFTATVTGAGAARNVEFAHASANFDIQRHTSQTSIVKLNVADNTLTAVKLFIGQGSANELAFDVTGAADSEATYTAILNEFNATGFDRKGYQMFLDGTAAGTSLQIYRTDGADFSIAASDVKVTHDAGNGTGAAAITAMTGNGTVVLAAGDHTTAGSIVNAEAGDTITVTLKDENFANNGGINELVFTTAELNANDTGADMAAAIENKFLQLTAEERKGYTLSVSGGDMTFSRTDGVDFQVKAKETQGTGGSTSITFTETPNGAAEADLAQDTFSTVTTAGTFAASKVDIAGANAQTGLKEMQNSARLTNLAVTTTGAFGDARNEAVLEFGGGYVSGKEYSVDLFGQTVSIVADDFDGFENTLNGLANQMSQAINAAGITGLEASVNNQRVLLETEPLLSDATVVKDQTTVDGSITLDQAKGTITLGATSALDNGDEYSFKINGTEIKFKLAADGFTNDDAGVRAQLKATIDAAGITGLTVTEGASGRSVTVAMNLSTQTNSKSTVATNVSVTDVATSTLSATDGKVAVGGSVVNGDVFSFNVAGTDISVTAGANGAELSQEGVAAQIAAAVSDAGVAGISVTDNGDGSVSFNTTDVKITDAQSAKDSIAIIDAAIETINSQRANLGGVSNRLDNTVTNLSNVSANLQSSLSRIQDADFATETSNLTKSQILSQAATAMLAQANASKQGVLSLLQG